MANTTSMLIVHCDEPEKIAQINKATGLDFKEAYGNDSCGGPRTDYSFGVASCCWRDSQISKELLYRLVLAFKVLDFDYSEKTVLVIESDSYDNDYGYAYNHMALQNVDITKACDEAKALPINALPTPNVFIADISAAFLQGCTHGFQFIYDGDYCTLISSNELGKISCFCERMGDITLNGGNVVTVNRKAYTSSVIENMKAIYHDDRFKPTAIIKNGHCDVVMRCDIKGSVGITDFKVFDPRPWEESYTIKLEGGE